MGRFGRECLGIGQLLLLIFLMASNIVTFNILMNVLTDHGTCTLVFGVVGLVICFLGALPRTMEKVYWMSVACKYRLSLEGQLAYWLLLSIFEYLCCCDHCHGCNGSRKQRPCSNPSHNRCELPWGILGCNKHHFCLPYVGGGKLPGLLPECPANLLQLPMLHTLVLCPRLRIREPSTSRLQCFKSSIRSCT